MPGMNISLGSERLIASFAPLSLFLHGRWKQIDYQLDCNLRVYPTILAKTYPPSRIYYISKK